MLMYMKKYGNSWRMDRDTYLRFIKHVRLYFKERIGSSEDVFGNLLYAELPVCHLSTICFLFGGYSRNDVLVLTEYFPRKDIAYPWERSFTLNIYTGERKLVQLTMESRQ